LCRMAVGCMGNWPVARAMHCKTMACLARQRRSASTTAIVESKIDDLTLARGDRAGTRVIRLGGEGIHEIVIVRGIVVK
jgi:hypothetical protein